MKLQRAVGHPGHFLINIPLAPRSCPAGLMTRGPYLDPAPLCQDPTHTQGVLLSLCTLITFRLFVLNSVLNGQVHIRDWRRELQREKPPETKRSLPAEVFKTRICWFFTHHPDGCVLPAARCPFAHGPEELRLSQTSKKQKQAP